jgi:hypothetical protein
MLFSKSFLRITFFAAAILICALIQARADKTFVPWSPPPSTDLFEVSVGFNYLHLGDAYPETANLYGFSASAFVNPMPWLSVGGEFMGDWGSKTYHIFNHAVDIDSQRLLYVFGPRFNVWQNSNFKVFLEALAGGVHAEAKLSSGAFNAKATDDGFAAAAGGGLDWRFARHFSWRIIQADYVPTDLSGDWQHDFRASTGIIWSFGER